MVLTRDTQNRRRFVKRILDKFQGSPSAPTSGMVLRGNPHTCLLRPAGPLVTLENLAEAILDQPKWMESHDLSRIISALSQSPKSLISGDLLGKLIREVASTDTRVATACCETLITSGHFSDLPPEALRRLGLSQTSTQWVYSQQADDLEINGGLFVMLLRMRRPVCRRLCCFPGNRSFSTVCSSCRSPGTQW